MGEQSTIVAVEESGMAPAPPGSTTTGRRRVPLRAVVVGAMIAALVAGSATTVAVAWSLQREHDEALSAARIARSHAVDAVDAQHDAVVELEAAAADGIALRDGVASTVIPAEGLLGGPDALAPVVDAHTALALVLEDEFGVEAPDPASTLPGAVRLDGPDALDREGSTDTLRRAVARFAAHADDAEAESAELAERTDGLSAAGDAVRARLGDLVSSIPALHATLLAGHPLASAESTATAASAVDALASVGAESDLVALLGAYATSASGVVAAHDAEAARIAAEQAAAAEAARRARSSGGGRGGGGGAGGGGSVTGASEQRGVLSETNAQRSANGVGALVWNGTLASRSCSFAAELAARNGDLYHSSNGGGFSRWGENVAYGYGSPSAVVAGWMGSSGHRANILNGAYTMMGACSSTSSTGRVYWVQQFGA